jgi:hypothetical protein
LRASAALAALSLSAVPVVAQDASRAVSGGGIAVAGWAGAVDAQEAKAGQTLANAKLATDGGGFRVTTGPATTYWNTKTRLTGAYTVKATFTEPKFQNLNDHPHPYGIVVAAAGSEAGVSQALYCVAYGTGTFVMRGFGPAPFRVGAPRPTAHPAINKAAGNGQPVTQDIAITVGPEKVACVINGTEVGSWPMSEIVGAGKLSTTDGFAGIRAGHNTEVVVTKFTAGK